MPLGRVAVPRRSWSCSRHLLQCRVLWFPAGWACQGRRSKWGRVVLIGLSGLENLCGRQQQAKNQQQFSMFCNYTKLRLSCPLCAIPPVDIDATAPSPPSRVSNAQKSIDSERSGEGMEVGCEIVERKQVKFAFTRRIGPATIAAATKQIKLRGK